MKQPRRRTSPSAPKKASKQASPEQIRAYMEEMYQFRQAAWHVELMQSEQPDWNCLIGLHLHMCELERLAAGLEELG